MIIKKYLREFKNIIYENQELSTIKDLKTIKMAKLLYKKYHNLYIADQTFKIMREKYKLIQSIEEEMINNNSFDLRLFDLNISYIGIVCTILIKYHVIDSYHQILINET